MKEHHNQLNLERRPSIRRPSNQAVGQLRAVILLGLTAAFGFKTKYSPWTRAFIKGQARCYEKQGDAHIRAFKALIVKARDDVYNCRPIDPWVKGKILPKDLRKRRFKGRNRTLLLQYLKISRAFPKPLSSSKAATLSEFYDRVGEPGFSDPDVLKSLKKFSRNLPFEKEEWVEYDPFRPYMGSAQVTGPSMEHYFGSSSCLDYKRSDGGRNSALRDVFGNIYQHRDADPETDRLDEFVMPSGFKPGKPDNSRAESVLIPELGCKFRVVTKNDTHLVAHGHLYRKALFRLLRDYRHISTAEGLNDPDLQEIYFPKGRKRFVYSADLTAATDLLNRDAVNILLTEIGIDPNLAYVESVDGKPCKRGTSMGLPVSWPVLSLIHYFVAATCDPSHSFRIKGDDLIALWTVPIWELYSSMMSKLGFVINKTKSFKSLTRGMFCEVEYLRVSQNRLVRQPIISLRSLSQGIPVRESWRVYHESGFKLDRLYRLNKAFCPQWFVAARQYNVDAFAPRSMGGMGLPPRNLFEKLRPVTSSLLRAVHNGYHLKMDTDSIPRGSYVDRYLRYFEDTTELVIDGDIESLEVLRHKQMIIISRAALKDSLACSNKPRKELSPFSVARECAQFVKRVKPSLPPPHEATYQNIFDILSRIGLKMNEAMLNTLLGYLPWEDE